MLSIESIYIFWTETRYCTKNSFHTESIHHTENSTSCSIKQCKRPTCKWCRRCFDKCHSSPCLVPFGRRACGKGDRNIYVVSGNRLYPYVLASLGVSYHLDLFSFVFTCYQSKLAVENAPGELILQLSQIWLIKYVDLLILHNGIMLLYHDIIWRAFCIGNRK